MTWFPHNAKNTQLSTSIYNSCKIVMYYADHIWLENIEIMITCNVILLKLNFYKPDSLIKTDSWQSTSNQIEYVSKMHRSVTMFQLTRDCKTSFLILKSYFGIVYSWLWVGTDMKFGTVYHPKVDGLSFSLK